MAPFGLAPGVYWERGEPNKAKDALFSIYLGGNPRCVPTHRCGKQRPHEKGRQCHHCRPSGHRGHPCPRPPDAYPIVLHPSAPPASCAHPDAVKPPGFISLRPPGPCHPTASDCCALPPPLVHALLHESHPTPRKMTKPSEKSKKFRIFCTHYIECFYLPSILCSEPRSPANASSARFLLAPRSIAGRG